MNRRDFLRTASVAAVQLAAVTGWTVSAAESAAPARKRSIKKAVGYGMVKEGNSVLDKFKLLKDLGYDGVEMPYPGGPDVAEVARARKTTGLEIANVMNTGHWKDTLGDPDPAVRARGLEGLQQALRDARAIGAPTVLLVPAVVNKNISYADAYARSQAEIRKALPLATELGVKIALENVWNNFLLSPLEAARYVDELGSHHVGWFFDVGNIVHYGWPEQWIRILGSRILAVHAKEFSRKRADNEGRWKGFNVELLEGDCDWPAVMKALDEIGYRGWLIAEVGGGDAGRLRDLAERMDKILAL